jgi:putative Mn2+ efflux pump MntP
VSGLVLVAVALGLSNLAAAIGIGLSGVDARVRIRVGLVFGLFEAGMPIVGLLAGQPLARAVGSVAAYAAGAVLVAAGGLTVYRARTRPVESTAAPGRAGPLIATAAALSVDNLVVGFALAAQPVGLLDAALVIGGVSAAMSLVGLEAGHRLGRVVERWSAELSGALLIVVGVAVGVGVL